MAKAKPNEVSATEGINRLRGRPSSFKPEFGDKVLTLCKLGATDRDLALHFNVSYNTIEDWKKRHPDFFVAVLRGKQEADSEVVESLFKNANGYDYYEEAAIKLKRIEYADGKISSVEEYVETVRVLRHQPADTTAQIYWMKNRRPAEWRDARQVEIVPADVEKTKKGIEARAALNEKGFVEIDGEYKWVEPKEKVE